MPGKRNVLSKELLLSRATKDELTGCINWNSARGNTYSQIGASRVVYDVHRAMFSICNPEIDISSLYVCHKCNNKRCINPEHLYAGTALDNARDAVSTEQYKKSRRGARGEKAARAKLTAKEVLKIRIRDSHGENRSAIAREHSVTPQCIDEIVKRGTWKHIP